MIFLMSRTRGAFGRFYVQHHRRKKVSGICVAKIYNQFIYCTSISNLRKSQLIKLHFTIFSVRIAIRERKKLKTIFALGPKVIKLEETRIVQRAKIVSLYLRNEID